MTSAGTGTLLLLVRARKDGMSLSLAAMVKKTVARFEFCAGFVVKCVSLGEIFDVNELEECDCLKIDCEGSEYEIFEKADEGDLRRVKSIVMEYHPNGRVEDIGHVLEGFGFSVEVMPKRSIVFAWRPALR